MMCLRGNLMLIPSVPAGAHTAQQCVAIKYQCSSAPQLSQLCPAAVPALPRTCSRSPGLPS